MMSGRQVSHFEVLAPLGSGGMGEVFLARDTRLDREVALKLLPATLRADVEARTRLKREARAASVLDHPNVCTIYEVGEGEAGEMFIAMAYCEGRTLAELLSEGPLPRERLVDIARQLASGLLAAHERGVIHRDIKPTNVMVSEGGGVKIVDFGLAQARSTSLTRSDAPRAGTADYMAPEQVLGERATTATDVWAFGVVLYEMLAGRRPFAAEYEQAALYRIVHDDPDALPKFEDAVDGRLAAIASECLRKDASRRPAIEDVLQRIADLDDGRSKPATSPGQGWGWRRLSTVTAFAAAGVAAIAMALSMLGAPQLPQEKGVVVLPLTAIGAPDDQLLSDGLTATLTNKLVQLSSYTDESYWVVPHSEVLRREVASPSAARSAFNATLALEGSLVREAGGVRLSLSLSDTRTLRTLRAVDFDLTHEEIGRLQDEAAYRLAEIMHLELRSEAAGVLSAGRTDNSEAYEHYLRGTAYLERYERKQNLLAAVEQLERATKLDPRFGAAFAALGEAHWRLYENTRDELHVPLALRHLDQALAVDERLPAAHITRARVLAGTDRPEEARRAVGRALALEPTNADAFLVLASVEEQAGDEAAAESALKRAITLRPSMWGAYNQLGVFYYRRARYHEAISAWHRVVSLTPDNARGYSNLGAAYYALDRLEEAAQHFERSIALDETHQALNNLASLYFALGDVDGAIDTFERALAIEDGDYRVWSHLAEALRVAGRDTDSADALQQAVKRAERQTRVNPSDFRAQADLAGMLVAQGRTAEARRLLDDLPDPDGDEVELVFVIGEVHALLGERAVAIEWLCRAVAEGYPLERILDAQSLAGVAQPAADHLAECAP